MPTANQLESTPLEASNCLIPASLRRKKSQETAISQGERVYSWLLQDVGVQPNWRILDIGCGDGCVAAAFARRPEFVGDYLGCDINSKRIKSLNKLFQSTGRTNFHFEHNDVAHSYYNPKGKLTVEEDVLKASNGSADLVILNSVFTHMRTHSIEHYLGEARRVLKPEGRIWATFFLLDDSYDIDLVDERFKLREKYDKGWTSTPENPEKIVIYDLKLVEEMAHKLNLSFRVIKSGAWKTSDQSSSEGIQDRVLLKLAEKEIDERKSWVSRLLGRKT